MDIVLCHYYKPGLVLCNCLTHMHAATQAWGLTQHHYRRPQSLSFLCTWSLVLGDKVVDDLPQIVHVLVVKAVHEEAMAVYSWVHEA